MEIPRSVMTVFARTNRNLFRDYKYCPPSSHVILHFSLPRIEIDPLVQKCTIESSLEKLAHYIMNDNVLLAVIMHSSRCKRRGTKVTGT